MTDSPMTPFHEMAGKSPEEAKFFWTGGPIEVAPRTWFQSLLSGVTAFETDDGLVLVDSGLKQFGAAAGDIAAAEDAGARPHRIFTQGHIDHAFGVQAFLVPGQAPPAHRRAIAPCRRASSATGHVTLQCRDQRAAIRRQRQRRRERRRLRQFPARQRSRPICSSRIGWCWKPGACASRSIIVAARPTIIAGCGVPIAACSVPATFSSGRCPMPATRRRYSAIPGIGRQACAPWRRSIRRASVPAMAAPS